QRGSSGGGAGRTRDLGARATALDRLGAQRRTVVGDVVLATPAWSDSASSTRHAPLLTIVYLGLSRRIHQQPGRYHPRWAVLPPAGVGFVPLLATNRGDGQQPRHRWDTADHGAPLVPTTAPAGGVRAAARLVGPRRGDPRGPRARHPRRGRVAAARAVGPRMGCRRRHTAGVVRARRRRVRQQL